MRSCDARRFLGLEPRVGEVRARRRLQRDGQFRTVILGEETDANGANRRHGTDEHDRDDDPGHGHTRSHKGAEVVLAERIGDDHDPDNRTGETGEPLGRKDERGDECA